VARLKFSERAGRPFSGGGTNLHGPLKDEGRMRHWSIPPGVAGML
jgi:hypothetical protein